MKDIIKASILTDTGAISVANIVNGKIRANGKKIVASLKDNGATYRKAIRDGYITARLAFNR